MARIEQLQLRYDPGHDRALLSVRTSELESYRMWLTRRYTAALWPILMRFVESEPVVQTVSEEGARRAVVGFQREKAIAETDFSKAFREDGAKLPFGSEPLVLTRAELRRQADGKNALWLGASDSRGLQLRPTTQLVHSLTKLLADVVAKADWRLDLESGWTSPAPEPSSVRLQ